LKNFIYICLAVFIAASCNSKLDYEGKAIFRYNEPSGISTLDPAFSKEQSIIWAVNQLFNGLVQMDNQLNVEPCIAKSWSISEDGLIYTFKLRHDVFFHTHEIFENGTRAVTASDFKYSFERLIAPETAAPGAWVFQKVNSFEAINDTTFIVHLKEPFTPFLGLLTMKYCSVVPQEIVETLGDQFGRNPIGTGPFKMKLWVDNEKLVLLKNELYFEKENNAQLPYLDAIAISFIPDQQSAFLEFSKGKMDFISGLDAGYKDELLKADGTLQTAYENRLILNTLPYLNTEYLGINMQSKHPALQNLKFRQALNYAINKEEMVKYLRNNIGTAAQAGMVPNGLPGFSKQSEYGYTFNSNKAKDLIIASQIDLKTIPTLDIVTTANYRDLCEYVQNAWQKVGIPVNVNVVPSSHLRELKANGEADIFRASWIADYPDAENYLSMFYTGNFTPSGPNYTFFSDSTFDKYYQEVRRNVDEQQRKALSVTCDSLVMHQAPVIPLFYDQAIRFYHNSIQNLEGNALNLLELKKVKKL
jgi:peptide/nickel transport system substrate-binding protein